MVRAMGHVTLYGVRMYVYLYKVYMCMDLCAHVYEKFIHMCAMCTCAYLCVVCIYVAVYVFVYL